MDSDFQDLRECVVVVIKGLKEFGIDHDDTELWAISVFRVQLAGY